MNTEDQNTQDEQRPVTTFTTNSSESPDQMAIESIEEELPKEAPVAQALAPTLGPDGKPVQLKVGYQFSEPGLKVVLRGRKEPVTQETLTHKLALRILKEHPAWFRLYMKRGHYPVDHQYHK